MIRLPWEYCAFIYSSRNRGADSDHKQFYLMFNHHDSDMVLNVAGMTEKRALQNPSRITEHWPMTFRAIRDENCAEKR